MHARNNFMIMLPLMAMAIQPAIQLCHGATPLNASEESKIIGLDCTYQCYQPNAVPCDPKFTPPSSGTQCQIFPALKGLYGIQIDNPPVTVDIIYNLPGLCNNGPIYSMSSQGNNDACQPTVYAYQPCTPPNLSLGSSCAFWNIWDCTYSLTLSIVPTQISGGGQTLPGTTYYVYTATCNQAVDPMSGSYVTGPTLFGGSGDACL
jgi:hypothetical protein